MMRKSIKMLLSIVAVAGTTLGWSTDISSWKSNYTSGGDIWIQLEDKPNNAQDWVGIYPKGSSNDWSNVVDWRWADNTSQTQVDPGDWYKFKLDDGAYEARFFLNNSFIVDDRISFTVGNGIGKKYGKMGDYHVEEPYSYNGAEIYYTKDKKEQPIVLFLTGWGGNTKSYSGLLKFIASHGYYVIALNETGSDSKYEEYANKFKSIIKDSKRNHPDLVTDKVGFLGHSSGGGYGFYIIDNLKKSGYATQANFVISLDGWFPFGMDDNKLAALDTTTLLLQFGGADGVDHMQDTRINKHIYNTLPGINKAFSFIQSEDHGYLAGDDISYKTDLLEPIHAMLDYTFKNSGNEAKNMALKNQIDSIIVHYEEDYYSFKCSDRGFNYCE